MNLSILAHTERYEIYRFIVFFKCHVDPYTYEMLSILTVSSLLTGTVDCIESSEASLDRSHR